MRLSARPLLAACLLPFALRGQDTAVRFNEIHYNPGPGSNAVEFVELRNLLSVNVDVSNWRIGGAVEYDLPEGTVIPAHGHLVVAANPAALQAATGFSGALGPWTGALDDNGETLRLYNNSRAFRTRPLPPPPPAANQLWNVDIQGDGNGGAFGQVTPTTKTGTSTASGFGGVWNAFTVRGHNATSANPSLALVDSAGAASPVTFSVQGSVSGFSNSVTGGSAGMEALTRDYLFVNAGVSATQIDWTLTGVPTGQTYGLWLHGGSTRDIRITVDKDGDGSLLDETPANAPAGGLLVTGITPSPAGVILGRAQNGSVSEGNWSGFQLFVTSTTAGAPPPGTADNGRENRRLMDEVAYDDSGDWPAGPDGSGFTLARRDVHRPGTVAESWTWSHARHGTPGTANFALTAAQAQVVPATALDSSANAAHGTPGGVTRTSGGGGYEGEAFTFAGAGFVDTPVNINPATRPQVTIGAWVRVSSLTSPARHTVLSSDNGGYDRGLNVDSRQGGTETGVARYVAFAGATAGPLGGTVATTADGWVFLCGVFNQTANTTTLHVNGTTFSAAHTHNASLTTLRIGAHHSVGEFFRGDIDNVFAFGRALTPAEIAAIRTGGAAAIKAPALAADLLALYEFEDAPAPSAPPAPPLPTPSLVFNECSGATAAVHRVELFNASTAAVNLTGWTLASSEPLHPVVAFTNGTLAAGAFLSLDETALGYRPADNERLFLLAPGGAALADALRVDDGPRARLPDGAGEWRRPSAASFGAANPAPPASPVVINEIFYRDTGTGPEEWIELHNPGVTAADLGGWKLGDAVDFTFPPGTSVPAGGYLVVVADPAAQLAKWPGRPVVGPFAGALSNDGEEIELDDPAGVTRDRVAYFPGGAWPAEADGGGSSLELRDPRADNGTAEAWAASDTTPAGAWQTITYRGVATDDGIGNDAFHELQLGLLDAGEVYIDDVSVVENPDTAPVSFLQNGTFESDAPGAAPQKWRCIGTHGSHGRTRVVTDPANPANRCLLVVSTGATDDTHNKIETTYAAGRSVVLGRTYEISFRARWKSGAPLLNSRLYFNYLQRTTVLSTGSPRGTPGAANSRAVANAGPTFSTTGHAPVAPTAGQACVVSARVADPDGVGAVLLFTSVNGGAFTSAAMSLQADGSWTGTVAGQAAGATVQYYVQATDGAGAGATWPARGAAGGAFIGVSDGLEDVARGIHNFRLLVSPAHRTRLFTGTERMSNDPVPGTLVENGRIAYPDIAVRLKASPSGRYAADGYGYHLTFQPDRPFRGVHGSITFERNPAMKEMLAKHMMNRAGGGGWSSYDDALRLANPVAAESGTALLSTARTSEIFFESLYGAAATPTAYNHELLYQPNGTVDGNPESLKLNNPYNHTRASYELQDRGADKEAYRWGWQMAGGRRLDDYAPIVRLNRAFALTGTAFDQEIDQVIDVDQWMRTWAMLSLNGNDDVYGRLFPHNWRLYPRPTDGRLIAIPWDLDRAFQLGTSDSLTPGNNLARLFTAPANLRLFRGHLLDIVNTTANDTHLSAWAAHYGAKLGVSLAAQVTWVQARSAFALSQLPAAVAFQITTNGGADFATATAPVTLAGKGWIDVATIWREGFAAPLDVVWTSADDWQAAVPLAAGANAITLIARDRTGLEVGRDTITVTSTAPVVLANGTHLAVTELHYHPVDPSPGEITAGFNDADDFQYLELLNVSAEHADLTGARLATAVSFDFPAGLTLAPGQRLVVARNPDALLLRHPSLLPGSLLGPWSGRLARGGETITVLGAAALPIRQFAYDDAAPWPAAPDGQGPSLVLMQPAASDAVHANGANWRASVNLHGTPGGSDSAVFVGDPDGDGDGDGWKNWTEHVLSRTGDAAPLSIQRAADGSLLLLFARNPGADRGVTLEGSDDLGTWTPVPGAARVGQLWQAGQNTLETWSVPATAAARQYYRLNVAAP